MQIDFISAVDGKVCLYSGSELIVASANSVELANAIRNQALDLGDAYCSSSMDFADEYGFLYPSEAVVVLTNALEIA